MVGYALLLSRLIIASAALAAVTKPAVTPAPAGERFVRVASRGPVAPLPDPRPWVIRATPPPPPVEASPVPSPRPPAAPVSPGEDVGASAVASPRGVLLVPVRGVRPEELADTYAAARGEGRSHDAIDIPAPKGTPVVAAAGGTVLKKFRSERGGVTLYVLLPDRRTIHYYAHLDRYADGIAEGKPVRAGDVLAYVGDTGNAGAGNAHLHFEVTTTDDPKRFWGGAPQNPYPLLVSDGAARRQGWPAAE